MSAKHGALAGFCLLVPVGLGVAVQGWEHDGQNLGCVVTDQTHDVLIIPVVQRSLRHLQRSKCTMRLGVATLKYTGQISWNPQPGSASPFMSHGRH